MIESQQLKKLQENASKLKQHLEEEDKHKHHSTIIYLGFIEKHACELDKNLCVVWNRLPKEKYNMLG